MEFAIRQSAFLVGAVLICTYPETQAQFVEKLDPVISRTGVDAALVSAAERKIVEIASDRLASVLLDPGKQAKMSPHAVDQVKRLKAGAFGGTGVERAIQLMSWVNSDAQNYSTPASGGDLNLSVSFSPGYNVARLTWSNVFRDYDCRTTVYSGAPTWSILSGPSVQVKEEAEYRIFRNEKLIATILGERAFRGGRQETLDPFDIGPISITLSGIIPGNPELSSSSSVPVLYDFDPYQGSTGQAVRYRVEARLTACAFLFGTSVVPPYTASGGISPFTISAQAWLDSDGDSVPDFYPAPEVSVRRSIPVASGLTVAATPSTIPLITNDMNVVQTTALASVVGGTPPYTFKWIASPTHASVNVANDTSSRATLFVRPSAQCEFDLFEIRVIAQDSLGRASASTVNGRIRSRPWTFGCP